MPSHLRHLLLITATTFALLSTVAPAADQQDPRTFTSADGRKIEATLLAVTVDKAKLKLTSGRAANIPVASFSETDQAYIKAWQEKRQNLPRLSELTTTVQKVESFKREPDTRITTTSYNLTIKNNSSRDIAGIVLDTHVYWKNAIRGNTIMEQNGGRNIAIGTIEKKESATRTLGPFTATDILKRGPERRSEKLYGAVIHVYVDGLLHSTVQFPHNVGFEFADYSNRREAIEEAMATRQKQLDIQDAERGTR